MARKNLLSLSSAEKQDLILLMLQYINDNIILHHSHIIHQGAALFEGHRHLLQGMENWLTQNGGGQFVPLPKWLPDTPIPQEFAVVKNRDNGQANPALINLNPQMQLPPAFQKPALCGYASLQELGNGINGWHGDVHDTIGGTMADPRISPYAPIFWSYHAFLDDIYAEWQTCENPGANRNFNFINFDVLNDKSKIPSGEVTEKLFKEWSKLGKEHLLNK